jgi:hypothetical protein
MQAPGQQNQQIITISPPITPETIIAILMIIGGSMIEIVPKTYHALLSNPIVFLVGMLVAAGLAASKNIVLAFAVAFFLVNLLRIMPKKTINKTVTQTTKIASPGVKEPFQPSGAIDWVTTNKKWFVEKVLKEKPVAIQEKEVSTYPIQA